ncbi:ethanolamine ammonia-lyase large subunit [Motilibacter peucedani]|uniref:Ethanolamine ammonia-lyase large subunit n=1 Tax=Motilibacter peucedani TaxID=598650 RepID=A0A420XJP6_9ACTN|nr:ethanolamine ammonia-lyase subunit EutB [Motilibacter peucedani]RKS67954.1 ethanolamine ammonia-lyase large subunit [Motilibacter peucedani]
MTWSASVRGETFRFADLRELLAKANEEKSGDQLAGIAAGSRRERVAAKTALADVRLGDIVADPVIDDSTTEALLAAHDSDAFAEIASLTVGELRELVLHPSFAQDWPRLAGAITPEVAAATAKLMSNLDLVAAAHPLRVITTCRTTMGEPGVLGCRVQPNHPADDVRGILLSALDGLLLGCGDALIGVNPATDSVDSCAAVLHGLAAFVDRLALPTQTCVLAHVTTQLAALERGAPVDLLFQSVAGTTAANASFGIDLALLAEGREAALESHRGRGYAGEHVTYFETGQGSALSAEAHAGTDQLVCEARAQAVARLFDPFLVNSVVGFIGPEYLADARQITRAGLEDHFVGKLMGLPMGCDICYTNHVDADQDSNDDLLLLLASAGCTFVMGVPASDDVMLHYQSTSYHDVATARRVLGLRPGRELVEWLEAAGLWRGGALVDTSASALPGGAPGRVLAELTA